MKILKAVVIGIVLLVPRGLLCDADEIILFDSSNGSSDYDCFIQVTQREYNGELTGEKPVALAQYSKKKWYFDVVFFDGETVAKYVSFPAALLVKQQDIAEYNPTLLKLMPRDPTKPGYRELLSVENGWIFVYNLWVSKDEKTGQPSVSVDLGKRFPIYTSLSKIDSSYAPWADARGNIFFKTSAGSYQWDSISESYKTVSKMPAPSDKSSVVVQATSMKDSDGSITFKSGSKEYTLPAGTEPEIIDPLDINLPGAIQKSLGDNLAAHTSMIRELKKLMREMGVRSNLKKWLTDNEVRAIKKSLDTGNKLGLGVVGSLISQAKTWCINVDSNGCLSMPWSYYRSLKSNIRNRKLYDPMLWENYSDQNAQDLIAAIQRYSKSVVLQGNNLKKFMDEFLKIKDQQSWQSWFENFNSNLNIELLFDYLATLSTDKLKTVLTNAGVSGMVKQRRLMMIVQAYATANVYSGLKVKKVQ